MKILNNHKERCLLINDTQAVKYETGIIKFKNYEKKIPIAFKIYADIENYILNSLGAKLVSIDNRFILPTIIFEGENCINKFINWIF